VHCKPYAIDRIIGSDGKTLLKQKPDCQQVIDAGIANQTVDILRTVISEGTGGRAAIGRPVAGNTGTAEDYKSAFFNGFTPQLSTSVWVGIPIRPTPMVSLGPGGGQVFGGTWPAMIFHQYMQAALQGLPVENFPAPPNGRPPNPAPKNQPGGVPNVVGKTVGEAFNILRGAGFAVSAHPVLGGGPAGRVVNQSPSAGSNAAPGSTVNIEVSLGGPGGRGGGGGGGGGGPGPPPRT
jgi:membrane peptidoglycan carboxypeptidase